jgi:hypothetical protein
VIAPVAPTRKHDFSLPRAKSSESVTTERTAFATFAHVYGHSDSQNYSYAESIDGLEWTDTIFLGMLGYVPNIAGYSGPIGMGDDPNILGKEFYVYYTQFRGPGRGRSR